MKILVAICCAFLLGACAQLTGGGFQGAANQAEKPTPYDQQLFVDGLNQLLSRQEPVSLVELQANFSGSPWAAQAVGILELHKQLLRQQQQLENLQKQLAATPSEQDFEQTAAELARYKTENKRLQEELAIQTQRLEALRELTIEMELK